MLKFSDSYMMVSGHGRMGIEIGLEVFGEHYQFYHQYPSRHGHEPSYMSARTISIHRTVLILFCDTLELGSGIGELMPVENPPRRVRR